MTGNAHDKRTLKERLEWIANWSEPDIDLADAAMTCQKCNGTGSYMYDENHRKLCEACCPHDQGWWLLKEHYGPNNGKLACKRGCGETRETNNDH